MTVDQTFFETKMRQQKKAGLRCAGDCGRKPTQSDHLFVPRGMGGHDLPQLQEDWNIVQLCGPCNCTKLHETAVRAALMKLWEYGPDYIEAAIHGLPLKVDRGLPQFYLDALELYEQWKRPFDDF
jgi:hypothetical protein